MRRLASQQPSIPSIAIICLAIVGAVTLSAAIPRLFDVDLEIVAVLFLGVLLVATFVYGLTRPGSSYFEPLFIAVFVLFGMYVTVPIALLLGEKPAFFKGYRMDDNYATALTLSMLGVVAFLLGYVTLRQKSAVSSHSIGMTWDPRRALGLALMLAFLAALLYSMFLRQSGTGLDSILSGRDHARRGVFDLSSAYFWSANQMLFPCSMAVFLLYLMKGSRGLLFLAIAIQTPQVILAVSQGNRIELLPIALGHAACFYLYKRKNPPALLVLVGFYLAVSVGLGFFQQIRIAGSDSRENWREVLVETISSPAEQLESVFWEGNSNDMFASLSIQLHVVPDLLPIDPLEFTYRTIAKVVPARLWSGKPVAPEEQIAQLMFPQETQRASSSPGMIGNSYQFAGAAGVVAVMFGIGLISKSIWLRYLRAPRDPTAIGLVALTLGFLPIAFRGAIGDTLSRMLFIVVPFLIIAWASRRPVVSGPLNVAKKG